MIIHNCHIHLFTNQHVPANFLPLGILKLLSKYKVGRKLGKILMGIKPGSYDDYFDRMAAFMNIGNSFSQEAILKHLMGFYPKKTRFVVLAMDMEFMNAGKLPVSYIDQLNELAKLKQKYPDTVLPFIAVDPRRDGVYQLVHTYIEKHHFSGIKLYPALGFFPTDPRLDPIYRYAEKNAIPIITHCSRGGIFYRGKISEQMRTDPVTSYLYPSEKNSRFTDNFSHPGHYESVLLKFPELKICLAHFGGGNEWRQYLTTPWDKTLEVTWFQIILDMLKKHKTVYSDISYTMYDSTLHPLLKILMLDEKVRLKILYGSDFYMVERDISERAYSITLRAFLGEENYQQMAETNAVVFLQNNIHNK